MFDGFPMIMRYLLLFLFLAACSRQNHEGSHQPLFQAVPSEVSGITFSNQLIENEDFNIIEYLYFYNGGGVAVGDINNDGLLDIYFSSNQHGNKLYLNKGNMQFEDITQNAGVASFGPWKTGVSMVDINGDGLLDIYVCRVSGYKGLEGKNELYINNGDLTFTESAALYGLDFQGFSTHAAFFDYDGDGDLDLYLLNHAVHTERSYGRASLRHIDDGLAGDKLYRNNLNKGEKRFTPVTNEAGIFSSQVGYGLGVGIADVNNDGWPDIYISNDFNENDYLYINQGDGTFLESIQSALAYSSRFSMGNDLADINNDGWIDIMTLDMLPEDEKTQKMSFGEDPYEIYKLKLNFGYERQASRNMLQLNQGDGTFSEIAQLTGVHATDWSWAVLMADFDNDGHKDIFVSNGIVRRPNDIDYINFITESKSLDQIKNLELAQKMPEGAVPNYFFKNKGAYLFENMTDQWIGLDKTFSNGAVYADLDNDGDLDLIINHINEKAGVFKNQTIEREGSEGNSFLNLQFKGKGLNSFGLGAKVIAYFNGQQVKQENFTSRGFQSSVAPQVHLGLGNANRLDSLIVIWPDQSFQKFIDLATNQSIVVDQAKASGRFKYPSISSPISWENMEASISGIDFIHEEDEYNDFNLEPLIPHKLSREGPAAMVLDFNGDGLEDLFFGGAHGQAAVVYLQQTNGSFKSIRVEAFAEDAELEDVTALWEDIDLDGLPDLIVGRGGNIAKPSSLTSDSKFYKNLGNGKLAPGISLPIDPLVQVSALVLMDRMQNDERLLFVGGRNLAGSYGEIPRSYILHYLGNGQFKDVTTVVAPELQFCGKVKVAALADLNKDGNQELIVTGEWMPIKVFGFQEGSLVDKTEVFGLANTSGWWNTLLVEDLNGNGYPDLILGNLGENTRIKAGESQPFKMWVKDLDDNGNAEQILSYAVRNQYFPLANRDELAKKLPSLKKRFIRNADFAGKALPEIFMGYDLNQGQWFEAKSFTSKVFMNNQGSFDKGIDLPKEAQFAPIQALHLEDLDNDGMLDLMIGGNLIESAPYFGAYLGSWGHIFKGDGKGNFLPFKMGSLGIQGQIQSIFTLQVKDEKWHFFVKNDDAVQVIKFQIAP
ncbi:VCBS repeat-containing protein [Cecembia lonarensis]|uniref:FG-GAP repeat protein n=1 Tax=Cecembia lonarensis (strain CCUG 58316 / KCTC 22772 / LW9) TaxID=1225176 RepID=K1L840_CECL9|nr:FG-GAP repeat protein [Cecembia lonarensis LW9]